MSQRYGPTDQYRYFLNCRGLCFPRSGYRQTQDERCYIISKKGATNSIPANINKQLVISELMSKPVSSIVSPRAYPEMFQVFYVDLHLFNWMNSRQNYMYQ